MQNAKAKFNSSMLTSNKHWLILIEKSMLLQDNSIILDLYKVFSQN